jgi:HK97 family phage portal protein
LHNLTTINGIRVYDAKPGDVIGTSIINGYSALTVPAYWRAINFLATNLASFPRSVHRDGAKADEPHPLDRILKRRPNAYQNATQFWRTLFAHAGHCGNGFAEIKRTATGRVDAVHNLLPEDVAPFRYAPDDGSGPQQFYYHATTKRILPAADVVHLAALSWDGMSGFDPVELLADTFQQAKAHQKYSTRYIQTGTVIKGAVEVPGSMTPEQLAQFTTLLRTHFSGSTADRDVMILTDGAKLNNSTITPVESQLVEQGASITKAIAQVTGVPPQFLYEFSESKYNDSIEQMGQDVVRYTFRPWIEQTEDELMVKLLTEQEQEQGFTIRLNPDALLRGDTAAQTAAVISTVNGGLRSRNEGRALLDLPPDSDPESDKLKTLGDTTVNQPKALPPKSSATSEGDTFAALMPVITAAVERVETKTANAFTSTAAKKPEAERVIWANVFAEQQAKYVADALAPVAETLTVLGGAALPVPQIAERYGAQVRRRAASGEGTDLKGIIADLIGRGEHGQAE